ncbi:hypothetical protein Lesp01_46750 [Lentzea sp. NBRC 102530]|nr:hypothetical protein Lesp01_46750 [Lentzea sp. NBRC 102530]
MDNRAATPSCPQIAERGLDNASPPVNLALGAWGGQPPGWAGPNARLRLRVRLVTGHNRVAARKFYAANGYELRKEQTNLIKWWA